MAAEKTARSSLITYQGTPLVVGYEVSDHGDVDITEILVKGVGVMEWMSDDVLAQIRDAVKRKEGI